MRRTRMLVATSITAAVALAGAGVGVANAATDPPALAFVAATQNVTADRYVDGDYTYLDFDLGVNLIAGKDPFEVRATRRSYADPIVAQQIVVKNGWRTAVTLPPGFMDDFGGFGDFTAITIKDKATGTCGRCRRGGSRSRTRTAGRT